MKMSDESNIQRAANHVGAVELQSGEYAHYADETSTYRVVDADEMAELCDYLDSDDEQVALSAYSHWCAGTSGREMPRGWTPDQTGDDVVVQCGCGKCTGVRCEWTGPRRETVVIEYMPEQYRGSHTAAGNSGSYPANGAVRVRVERSCAESLVEHDGDWTSIVNAD